jgi:NAD(P)-dependent dehydrogenase (short-subunit alcohol dehydrogenase family)
LVTHRLDVRDSSQLDAMLASVDEPFERVIHNAGIMRAPRADIFEVNTEAPIRIVHALLDGGHINRGGVVAIMTSQMGSRSGRAGSLGDYGDSKAALNDEFRRRAPAWGEAGVVAVVLHPGWVQTDMGGAGASLTIEESVDGVTEVLDRLAPDQHGSFLDWRGRELPW